MSYKNSILLGTIGLYRDRFHQFQVARSLEERLEIAKKIPRTHGVEPVYPQDLGHDGARRCGREAQRTGGVRSQRQRQVRDKFSQRLVHQSRCRYPQGRRGLPQDRDGSGGRSGHGDAHRLPSDRWLGLSPSRSITSTSGAGSSTASARRWLIVRTSRFRSSTRHTKSSNHIVLPTMGRTCTSATGWVRRISGSPWMSATP